MRIKKSVFKDIIREEVQSMVDEGMFDAFKQGVLSGFTKGGKDDSWYSKFAQGMSLPSQAKRVIDGIDDLIDILKKDSSPEKPTEGSSATSIAIEKVEKNLGIKELQGVVEAIKQDLMLLHASPDDEGSLSRSLVRGLTGGGTSKSFLAQLVQSVGFPDAAKDAITAIDSIVGGLDLVNLPDVGDRGKIENTALSKIKSAVSRTVGPEQLKEVAKALKQDLMSLFAQLGADAPKSDAPDEPEADSEAPEEEDRTARRIRRLELDESRKHKILRNKIRKKLQRFTF